MWSTEAEIYILLGDVYHITKSKACCISTETHFLNTFPLLYRLVLICSSFRKYYLPAATDNSVTATATATVLALALQIDSSFAATKTAETEIRTEL
jgi:hypothetical protein